ncbi:MAG: hypothetical protein CMJ78_02035 [Planctomycetaceae bacterium]|nr:hypothetical protein [Planctomycetaceae bacterium]
MKDSPNRCSLAGCFAFAICFVVACEQVALAQIKDFKDPAPPTVATLREVETPKAVDYEPVKFHSAPKPLAEGAVTHDWVNFLGPTHNSVSTETKLLKKFPAGGPKIVWELTRGDGYSSPGIQGDYLVYPHRVGNETIVECLHPRTGKKYWEFKFPTDYSDRYGYGSGPRASPVIHDGRVYIYSAKGELFCLKLTTGQVYWQRKLLEELQVPQDFFGSAQTPLLEGDLLIMNVGARGGPCVVAVHRLTGKIVWATGDKWGPSYASATPSDIHGKRRVFVFAGGDSDPPTGGLMSIDPASGAVDFEFPFRSKSYESVNASCPVVIGNSVFISATYKTGSAFLAIKDDFSYDPIWQIPDDQNNRRRNGLGLHWNTAVYDKGYFYAFDGRNEPDASIACVDAKTGKVVWREEPEWDETVTINGMERTFTLSTLRGTLLKVDGNYLALGEYGHLLWLDLTPQGYKQIDRATLFLAQQSWAVPVLSHGLLYVTQNQREMVKRTPRKLYCYDLRGK